MNRERIVRGLIGVGFGGTLGVLGKVSAAFAQEGEGIEIKPTPWESYSLAISQDQEGFFEAVTRNKMFEGFRGMSVAQVGDTAFRYYPVLRAAEEKYSVPALLLLDAIIQETTGGLNPNPDYPNGLPHIGIAQRTPTIYDESYVSEAVLGWVFLADWQKEMDWAHRGYSEARGFKTNDFEEIMFAARKMNEDAGSVQARKPWLTMEESLLEAQYHYMREDHAKTRVDYYKKYRGLIPQSFNLERT